MNFSIPSATFREALLRAKLALPPARGNTLPMHSAARFHVTPDGGTLEITSSDMDVHLTQRIPLTEPGGPGTVIIQLAGLTAVRPDKNTPVRVDFAPLLHAFAPDLPNCQILYVSGNHSAKAELDTLADSEFFVPEFPGAETYNCMLPGKTLAAIAASLPFQSEDETRYVLNGVHLTPDGGGQIVATNGRLLAKWAVKATPEPMILPVKACRILARLKPTSASASLIRNQFDAGLLSAIAIRTREFILHTKLIEGRFPNYLQVIPSESSSAITFADPAGVASWLATLKTSKGASTVRLTPRAPHYVDLYHEHGRITATAYLQGQPPTIAFNPEYLAQALTVAPGTLSLIDSNSPGTLRHAEALIVLMPMRISTPAEETAETTPEAAAA